MDNYYLIKKAESQKLNNFLCIDKNGEFWLYESNHEGWCAPRKYRLLQSSAKWVQYQVDSDVYICSNCEHDFLFREHDPFNFCPVCGAKMDDDPE